MEKAHTGPSHGLCLCASAWAVLGGQVKFIVGSPSAFYRVKSGPHILGAGLIPASGFIFPFFPFGLGTDNGPKEHPLHTLESPSHQIRELAIRLYGLPAQSFRGFGPFPPEHGAKVEEFKKRFPNNPDGAQTDVFPMLIEFARLPDFHQPGLLEIGNSAFATPLPDAGRRDKRFHVHVHKAVVQGGCSKAQGRQIKKGERRFNDDLIGFAPFGSDLPIAPVQGMAFLRMAIPCLRPFRRQRKDARQAPSAFTDGLCRYKPGMRRVMPATVPAHAPIKGSSKQRKKATS
jgi:hypothetical protein